MSGGPQSEISQHLLDGTDIHGLLMVDSNDCGDILSLSLGPPAGFFVLSEMS